MMKLERKWWFVTVVGILAALGTVYLVEGAGLPGLGQMNVYQAALFCLAFAALSKAISFALWLVALWLRPALATQR